MRWPRTALTTLLGVISAAVCLSGCVVPGHGPDSNGAHVAGTHCTNPQSLSGRLRPGTPAAAADRLRKTDAWLEQLSDFERSARHRSLRSVSRGELRDHLAAQALAWTAEEAHYWNKLISRLSEAMAGLNLDLPDAVLAKTTGYDEFGFAYARPHLVAIPAARAAIAGDTRRDFYLLAHEVFHLISWHHEPVLDELYTLLGFQRFEGFDPVDALERRRMSNPAAHTYDHALEVETPDGPKQLVPAVRSGVPLAELIEAPPEGPAVMPMVEFFLIAVDTRTGRPEMRNGSILTYGFDETDWRERLQRNTTLVIHPNEILADNFASLMEWRSNGDVPADTPGGGPLNDPALLAEIEAILSRGC